MRIFSYIARTLVISAALLFAALPAAQAQELPLGSKLPSVSVGGQSLPGLAGSQGTVVVFWSNQCLWTGKYADRVKSLAKEFSGQGFNFVLVNANDASAFPQESAEEVQSAASKYPQMTYFKDASAAAAQAFGAVRTPHVYVFDGNESLVYAGAVDDSPSDPSNVQEPYLENALQALAGGQDVSVAQTKAFGCQLNPPQ